MSKCFSQSNNSLLWWGVETSGNNITAIYTHNSVQTTIIIIKLTAIHHSDNVGIFTILTSSSLGKG